MTDVNPEITLEERHAALRKALLTIRAKVHSHNRGGELHAGLRDVVRNLCDQALATDDSRRQ